MEMLRSLATISATEISTVKNLGLKICDKCVITKLLFQESVKQVG